MPQDQYQSLLAVDVSAAMRVYWLEMIYRVHFGAATTAARTRRWMSGAIRAAEEPNLLAYAACLRGFVECSADSFVAFCDVPATLADCHVVIKSALDGRQSQPVLAYDLESTLIHFSHARRIEKGLDAPASHRAEQVAAYLDGVSFADPEQAVRRCYELLCQYTHPSAHSVFCFAEPDEAVEAIRLSVDSDHGVISSIREEHAEALGKLLLLGVAPALTSLRVLNEFNIAALWTPGLQVVETLDAWHVVLARLRDPSPPVNAVLAESHDQLLSLTAQMTAKPWL